MFTILAAVLVVIVSSPCISTLTRIIDIAILNACRSRQNVMDRWNGLTIVVVSSPHSSPIILVL